MNRDDFPILKRSWSGRTLVYFDNAATSQKPQTVIKAVSSYYRRYNSNVHRALNPLAEEATKYYEEARIKIANFIGSNSGEIIFTRGATEGINLVARSWGEKNLRRGDLVILTIAEHHANLVPWLQLKERLGINISYIELKKDGSLDLTKAKSLISHPRAKLIAVTQASNVLGIINPLNKLLAWAKKNGLTSLVDASQAAAHLDLNFKELDCDFLVFSGHKLGGPTGLGVLVGKRNILISMPPFLGGGDMISEVHQNIFTSAEVPYKFEAGTPHIAGAIGLGAAIDYISSLGWKKIIKEEQMLTKYFLKVLLAHPFVRLIGQSDVRLPIFSLVIEGLHPHDAADLLGRAGIMLRAGFHCAQPLHEYLSCGPTLRVSLSFYNTKEEIDYFFKKLTDLYRSFSA